MLGLSLSRHLYGDPYRVNPIISEKKQKLYESCNLSPSTPSSGMLTAIASELSALEQTPRAQYYADIISRGDLSCDPSIHKMEAVKSYCDSFRKIYHPLPQQLESPSFTGDAETINRIFKMTWNIFVYATHHMAKIDPSASSQHVATFKPPLAANNGAEEEKDDQKEVDMSDDEDDSDDEEDDDSDDGYGEKVDAFQGVNNPSIQPTVSPLAITTHVLADDNYNPFRQHQQQQNLYNNNPYHQRECRFDHIVVDLEQNTYHKYPVTSITAPYGVVEGKQRGYMLLKAADLYGIICNSMQFIFTSMMGMVYFDAVVTTNNGEKLGKRIMSIADLVSFMATCFGFSQEMANFYNVKIQEQWNFFPREMGLHGVKIETDWDYIKFVAAKYRQNVSDSFKELVIDAITDYDPHYKPSLPPSPYGILRVTTAYHMKPYEIVTLRQMIGITADNAGDGGDDIKLDSADDQDDDDDDEEGKDDHDLVMIFDTMSQGLDVIEAQQADLSYNFEQWVASRNNDEQDPYMQVFGHPDGDMVDEEDQDEEKVQDEADYEDAESQNEDEEKCVEGDVVDDNDNDGEGTAEDDQKVTG